MPSIHVNFIWCIAMLVRTGFANGMCVICVLHVYTYLTSGNYIIPSASLIKHLKLTICNRYMNYEWPFSIANRQITRGYILAVLGPSPLGSPKAGALVRRARGAASPTGMWMTLVVKAGLSIKN